jgi:hypothetical protein
MNRRLTVLAQAWATPDVRSTPRRSGAPWLEGPAGSVVPYAAFPIGQAHGPQRVLITQVPARRSCQPRRRASTRIQA